MKRLLQIGTGMLALAAFTLVAGTQAEAKCSRYSASAVGITQEMAKGLAKVNLDFVIGAAGAKAKTKTKYACSGPLLAECKASQRACT